MSAPDVTPARRLPLAPQRYGRIVVVGGGCYGSYYVRQLARAVRAGAIVADEVVVVDRDPSCRVALAGWDAEPGSLDGRDAADATPAAPATRPEPSGRVAPQARRVAAAGGVVAETLPRLQVEIADWNAWFGAYLAAAAADPDAHARDAIVPSPLMPHLMYEWLLARARARWPGRAVETRPLPRPPATPWERAAPDGTHYASFAEWMCPINCVEPVLCPHTRGPRWWSLPHAVRGYADALAAEGTPVAGPVILHCVHRAWGVGMFDVADVVAADRVVAREGTAGAAAVLVGTVSHCHGALNLLHLGDEAGPAVD